MMRRHVALVGLLALVFMLSGCFAPTGSDILVSVIDINGDPLSGVEVSVTGRGLTASTDADGEALIRADLGEVTLSATYDRITGTETLTVVEGLNTVDLQIMVGPTENVAVGKTITATGMPMATENYADVSRVVNGDTSWSYSNMAGVHINQLPEDAWDESHVLQFDIDLGQVEQIREITGLNPWGQAGIGSPVDGKIFLSNDGENWVEVEEAEYTIDTRDRDAKVNTLNAFFYDLQEYRYVRVAFYPEIGASGFIMCNSVEIRAIAR